MVHLFSPGHSSSLRYVPRVFVHSSVNEHLSCDPLCTIFNVLSWTFCPCLLENNLNVTIDLFIFRQKGREEERKGEKHHCVVASWGPPTGDLACNPGRCPDWELNRRPFDLQAGTQFPEPHQPGPNVAIYNPANNKYTGPVGPHALPHLALWDFLIVFQLKGY